MIWRSKVALKSSTSIVPAGSLIAGLTDRARDPFATGNIHPDHESLENLIERFGTFASDALADPRYVYFTVPNIEGVIGYRAIGSYAVVAGEPLCSRADVPVLARASRMVYTTSST